MNELKISETASCSLLLGALFVQRPKEPSTASMINGLLTMDLAEEWPFGEYDALKKINEILNQAQACSVEQLDRDYHHLFIGPNELKAAPWGSCYLDPEHVLFGDSTILLVRWMKRNGVALFEEGSREPADHVGRMFVLLSWLCENKPELIDEFLSLHFLPWAPMYFDALEAASESDFYTGLGQLGSLTLQEIAQLRGLPWRI